MTTTKPITFSLDINELSTKLTINNAYLEKDEADNITTICWGDGLTDIGCKELLENQNPQLYQIIVDKYGDKIDDAIVLMFDNSYPDWTTANHRLDLVNKSNNERERWYQDHAPYNKQQLKKQQPDKIGGMRI